MAAEVLEQNQTPTTAAELLQLPVHEFGTQTPEILIDPRYSKEAQTVLATYIKRGLNVAQEMPTRAERIARGIVHEVVTMTPEKAGKIAKNAITTYIKNVNPANFIKEDWYWRGGVGLGVGIGTILTVTGARVNPWIRTSVTLGLSAGFATLANIDYQNAVKKLDKLELGEEEKVLRLAELEKIKTKAVKIKKGMSAGFAYLGFINMGEAAEASTHFIEEGAKAIDWSKAQLGEVLSPKTAYAAELPQSAGVPLAMADEYTVAPPEPVFESAKEKLVFGNIDKLGNDRPSLYGLKQAELYGSGYGIGELDNEGVAVFDPDNITQVADAATEVANDPEAEDKIRALTNYFIFHENSQRLGAFSIDPNTHLIDGNTLSRTFKDQDGITHLTGYDHLSAKGTKDFLDSGEWKKWVDVPQSHLTAQNTVDHDFEWSEKPVPLSQEPDPIYSQMKPEELNIEGTYLQPENLQSGIGHATSIEAEQFYGIKGADGHFNAQDPAQFAAYNQAVENDPLHDYRAAVVDQQLHADSKKAFYKIVDPDTGEVTETDLLVSIQPNKAPTELVTLKNYHSLLTGLVNEAPASEAFDGTDVWMKLDPTKDLVIDATYTLENGQSVYQIEDLAMALMKKYNFAEFAGGDEEKLKLIRKALVRYLQDNEPEGYFTDQSKSFLKLKSLQTGNFFSIKLPKEEIMRRILGTITHGA